MDKKTIIDEVLKQIAGSKKVYQAKGRGQSKWSVGNDIVHVRFRTGSMSSGSTKYSYNINKNSLASDFELWICGSTRHFYLIPINVMEKIYNTPSAYPDYSSSSRRVVATVDLRDHEVSYASDEPNLSFRQYFRASLDDTLEIIEAIVSADLASINDEEEELLEGGRIERHTNHYERNPKLRAKAIFHHGTKCMACNFDFADFYGEYGSGFIEVHHLKPVSELAQRTKIDPRTDMIVLCSNCHRIVHRKRGNILSLEELKGLIKNSGKTT